MNTTVVVYHPPKKRTKKAVRGVSTICYQCGGRKSYRSPNHLCRSCQDYENERHRLGMMITCERGGPFYSFYILPEEERVAEKNRQATEASYTTLYGDTPPNEEVTNEA